MGAEALTEAQKRVLSLRKEHMTKLYNPYRHMTAEGGHVVSFFDSSIND
jgi:hypothetical protein